MLLFALDCKHLFGPVRTTEITELSVASLDCATQSHLQLFLLKSFEEQNIRLFFVLSLQEFGIIANLCTSTSPFKT